MTLSELCKKDVIQLGSGIILGKTDDLIFDEQTTQINGLLNTKEQYSELKKFGIATSLFADIVDHYGVISGGYDNKSHEFIERVIQYIYEHYAEEITLNKLSEIFCIEPKFLSSKLSRYTGTDLRMFVSDIRLEKALQMMSDPEMRDKPRKEIALLCGFKSERTFYDAYKRNAPFYNLNEKK